MARYKYPLLLAQTDDAEFDKLYEPGAITAGPGIYKCQGCGKEVVHTTGKSLPSQDHHQHTSSQGRILWRLVVTDSAA
jgi:hypothetical protein